MEEAEATCPNIIILACPFCMLMFDLRSMTLCLDEKGIELQDIAELEAESMEAQIGDRQFDYSQGRLKFVVWRHPYAQH